MPPKKRGTRTRTALQAKQPVKQEQEEVELASTKRDETTPDDQPQQAKKDASGSPVLSLKRLRIRTETVSEGGKQSSAKASKAKQSTAKAKKAEKKMASKGAGRKRTKKAYATAGNYFKIALVRRGILSRDVSCDSGCHVICMCRCEHQ